MLRRISIFWIIFSALLVTSAVPLGVVSYNAITTTSAEVEETQTEQLLLRVQANAGTINEQFRQFEITTNMAGTRTGEVLDDANTLVIEDVERSLSAYRYDAAGVYGLDAFYRDLTIGQWVNNRFTVLVADLDNLEIYATQANGPLTIAQWEAYGFTVVDTDTSAELMQINRDEIPTIITEAQYIDLGFTILRGDPIRNVITGDQIGVVPSPEVINVSNVYLNSQTDLTDRIKRQIVATEDLDDLFQTIRSEEFGSQWVYLTTAEGMMRLYPWHPNQYGPPNVWPYWEPQTILFYTAASDQGVKILQRVQQDDSTTTIETIDVLTDATAVGFFRNPDAFACGTDALVSLGAGQSCAVDCTDANAPLYNGRYPTTDDDGNPVSLPICQDRESLVVLTNTASGGLTRTLSNTAIDDDTTMCYSNITNEDGSITPALPDGTQGNAFDGACYVDCTDTSDPVAAQYCNVACGATNDPLQPLLCAPGVEEGVVLVNEETVVYDENGDASAIEFPVLVVTEIEPASAPSLSTSAFTLPGANMQSCPAEGVTDAPCYVDCAIGVDALHPLHADYCRGTVWTAPYYDYAGQGLMVTNSVPIYDNGNAPIAVMSHDLRIDVMEEQVLQITDEDDETSYAFFLDSSGQIIAHPRFQASQFAAETALIGNPQFRNLAQSEPEISDVVERMIEGDSGVTEYTDANGDVWIVAYAEIESTGWHLGLAQTREEIIRPATEITNQVFFGAIGAITIVSLAAFVLARAITRPVTKLSNAAKIIEASVDDETGDAIGKNLDSLKNITTAREIANLSNVFEQMVEALQRRMVELNSIYAMGQTITANVEFDDTLRAVLNAVKSVVAFDAAEISILRGNSLVVEAWSGEEGFNDTTGRKYRLGRGPTGQIGETKQSLLIGTVTSGEDIQRTLGYASPSSEFLAKTTKVVINSFLGIPLLIGDRVIGTLTLVHREADHFKPDDERQLSKLAAQASVAIQNAIQVREREKQLKRQIEELRIEIDQTKVKEQIDEVTDSDFFRGLQQNARSMRRRFGKSVEDTDTIEPDDQTDDSPATAEIPPSDDDSTPPQGSE